MDFACLLKFRVLRPESVPDGLGQETRFSGAARPPLTKQVSCACLREKFTSVKAVGQEFGLEAVQVGAVNQRNHRVLKLQTRKNDSLVSTVALDSARCS